MTSQKVVIVISSEREAIAEPYCSSGFALGKSLPSSPWSYKKLPFASWPAAILVDCMVCSYPSDSQHHHEY